MSVQFKSDVSQDILYSSHLGSLRNVNPEMPFEQSINILVEAIFRKTKYESFQ